MLRVIRPSSAQRLPALEWGEVRALRWVPIEAVSKRLGHSTIAITVDRYLVVYRERDEAAAAAFETLVG